MFDSKEIGKYKASHASKKTLRAEAFKILNKQKKIILFLQDFD